MIRPLAAAAFLALSAATLPSSIALAQAPAMSEVRLEARPDRQSAQSWSGEGRTLVINLLTEPENEALGFDYAETVMSNGMMYASVPVGRMTGSDAADTVARILAEADGPVVINCASGTRASHVYAASQIRAGNITRDQLHLIDPDREWNQEYLSRLLGETPAPESGQ
ncbi:MAG: beta-lactamase hydrolase domain-containing protein [Caulobacterales bacterium]|uniref:beta-lactamase hydrolase domain-containing protein n=1 Tax=Glycocaulis sp. TaxID=1969725 RepID=UPI003FA12A2D